MFSAGETVTVVRPAERNRDGDPIAGSGSFDVDGCAIIQQSTVDNNGSRDSALDGRQSAVTIIELLAPAGADIKQGDKVRFGGAEYLVEGLPWTPHNPFTAWEPGLKVRLRGVK